MKTPHDQEARRRPRQTVRESPAFQQWSSRLHSLMQDVEAMPTPHKSAAIEELEFARVCLGIGLCGSLLRERPKRGYQRLVSLINAYLS